MSGPYIQELKSRIEFIEFKQNVLFLNSSQQNLQFLNHLSLDEFIKIKKLTDKFSNRIEKNEKLSISDYEKELIRICFPLRYYPSCSTLIAKALIKENIFNKISQS